MIVILSDQKPDTFPEDAVVHVRSPREYITYPARFVDRHTKIINLARDCDYMGIGYYVSLLAEARGHQVIPSVETLVNLDRKSLWKMQVADLEEAVTKRMSGMDGGLSVPMSVFIAFGRADDERFDRIGRQVFERFRFPLIRMHLARTRKGWRIKDIESTSPGQLSEGETVHFRERLSAFLRTEWRPPKPRTIPRYSLALLYDPQEALPPSNKSALRKFARAGEKVGIDVELITRADFPKLAEYDALFIRETTNVNHYTFTFARKAAEEGMPVMDDPLSILRCTNKVFLAEILAAHSVPTPQTVVLDRRRLRTVDQSLAFPMVLKMPDGSFSRGVHKVADRDQLMFVGSRMLDKSDLILAQAFTPTAFDWRVGVLNRQPLFVCRYFMSKGHWQIVNHRADGKYDQGTFETLPVEDAPQEVIALAVRAAALMGDGLYGVDIKENEQGLYVIEVNDNPNLDAGVEDRVLKGGLYTTIMREFLRRLEAD